jgi:hypothetical protein
VNEPAPRLKVLIVTGHDHFHHRWRVAATRLRDTLEAASIFDAKITEEFRGAGPETLEPYDCVVLAYFGATAPGEKEERWGHRAEEAIFDFARSGGGIVFSHSAFAMGGTWDDAHGDELLRLAGGLMQPASRRVPGESFAITIEDAQATRATGREVGPSVDVATRTMGFANFLRRGTEWAATGAVTLPVVDAVEAAAPA